MAGLLTGWLACMLVGLPASWLAYWLIDLPADCLARWLVVLRPWILRPNLKPLTQKIMEVMHQVQPR